MDYFTAVGAASLLLGFVLWVGYPLYAAGRPRQPPGVGRTTVLQERKEQLYTAIKDLEFDRELGKLSAADYQRLRPALEAEALQVLQQLDQANGHPDEGALRARIEREVRVRRQPHPPTHCPSCGAGRKARDRFCSQCGFRFDPQAHP